MSENSSAEAGDETTEGQPKAFPNNRFHNSSNQPGSHLRYTGDENPPDQNDQSGLEFTFEIIEIDGPEGHHLTLAQARALRRALEWAVAHDQHTTETDASGDGEEKPRAA